jgi:hypothetical protein
MRASRKESIMKKLILCACSAAAMSVAGGAFAQGSGVDSQNPAPNVPTHPHEQEYGIVYGPNYYPLSQHNRYRAVPVFPAPRAVAPPVVVPQMDNRRNRDRDRDRDRDWARAGVGRRGDRDADGVRNREDRFPDDPNRR